MLTRPQSNFTSHLDANPSFVSHPPIIMTPINRGTKRKFTENESVRDQPSKKKTRTIRTAKRKPKIKATATYINQANEAEILRKLANHIAAKKRTGTKPKKPKKTKSKTSKSKPKTSKSKTSKSKKKSCKAKTCKKKNSMKTAKQNKALAKKLNKAIIQQKLKNHQAVKNKKKKGPLLSSHMPDLLQ